MLETFRTYTQNQGGRIIIFFLLFLLSLYEFYAMGIVGLALVCMIPAMFLFLYVAFKYPMAMFWFVFTVNYFVMGVTRYYYVPVPITVLTVLPQLLLLMVIIIDPDRDESSHYGTPMLLAITIWLLYLILQIFNRTCQLPLSVGDWIMNINFFAFYFFLAYFIITKLIREPEKIMKFLRLWAYFSIAAAFWAWRQATFGFDNTEMGWLMSGPIRTHIIGGSTRYFSFFSDAANFGCSIAASAVAFYIVAITTKLRKDKILFAIAALASTYGMFTSGTRSGLMCFIVGIFLYIFLSKSFKIAVPVCIVGGLFIFFLAFTNIGQGNQMIRRMRTAFDRSDASKNVRDMNKAALKKYLQDAPFGMGININEQQIPPFNKFRVVYETSNDSTYVFFWQRTGIVGVFVFAGMNIIILLGGCYITFFMLRTRSSKGIGAAFCCAFLAIQAGGYANHILTQYPNIILYYGGMAIVYLLPTIEDRFERYEERLDKEEQERQRLLLEKKKASRV